MPPLIRRKQGRKPAAAEDWKGLLRRGSEHLRLAEATLTRRQWQGAALASFHAFRSLAEALVAFRIGLRTATEGTGELVYLLLKHFQDAGVGDQVEKLIRMSDLYLAVRFEPRSFTETEARKFYEMTSEFSHWSLKRLPSAL